MTGSTITFSRRRKGSAEEASAAGGAALSSEEEESFVTAPSVLSPLLDNAAEASTADSSAAAGVPKGHRHRQAPSLGRVKATTHAQHMAELKAHFAEVDAFELVVETPTPKKGQRAVPAGGESAAAAPAQAHGENVEHNSRPHGSAAKVRPMSLGLSRRSSMVALPPGLGSARKAARASHVQPSTVWGGPSLSHQAEQRQHRESWAGSSTAAAAAAGVDRRASAVVDDGGQRAGHRVPVQGRSSVAGGRNSMAGRMLSRLSMGLSEALQWLSMRGSVPAAAEPAGAAEPLLEEPSQACVLQASSQAPAGDTAGMSPITEELEPAGSSPASEQPGSEQQARTAPHQPPAQQQPSGDVPSVDSASVGQVPAGPAAATQDEVAVLQQELEAKLDLAEPLQELPSLSGSAASVEDLTPLQQLLLMCGQELDVGLLPTMDSLLGRYVDLGKVHKIGEGTFGEAFKAGAVVFKIVPMEGSVLVNGEVQKRADEILAEAAITLTLSGLRGPQADTGGIKAQQPTNVTSGFVETFGVGVCRGQYAAQLKQEWHRWDQQFESENDPVDIFQDDQLFVVFVVADGGLDLEHYEIRSFKELRSILLQVCVTLAVAEEGCQFEHRDLHWGNLLIQRDGSSEVGSRLRGCDVRARTAGVTVTLIDFTLSRLVTAGEEPVFCNLAADPELFKGPKGDVQAETYRRMKKATKNQWDRFTPSTNCLWMHYLADICLAHKLSFACSSADKLELRGFRKRALGYSCCADLLWDEFFAGDFLAE